MNGLTISFLPARTGWLRVKFVIFFACLTTALTFLMGWVASNVMTQVNRSPRYFAKRYLWGLHRNVGVPADQIALMRPQIEDTQQKLSALNSQVYDKWARVVDDLGSNTSDAQLEKDLNDINSVYVEANRLRLGNMRNIISFMTPDQKRKYFIHLHDYFQDRSQK